MCGIGEAIWRAQGEEGTLCRGPESDVYVPGVREPGGFEAGMGRRKAGLLLTGYGQLHALIQSVLQLLKSVLFCIYAKHGLTATLVVHFTCSSP